MFIDLKKLNLDDERLCYLANWFGHEAATKDPSDALAEILKSETFSREEAFALGVLVMDIYYTNVHTRMSYLAKLPKQ